MEFPRLFEGTKVVIATKGLPCTGKTELARRIGVWARCPVLYIDDFLYTLSKEKGYKTTKLPPSSEEVDRLHRVAFDGLCNAATRQLDFDDSDCVVIKSRLNSTFELDRLAELSSEFIFQKTRIIIIECQVKNEYRFQLRLDDVVKRSKRKEDNWYRPRSWKDIEKVREECGVDAQDKWELHLLHLLNEGGFKFRGPKSVVIRLVLDSFDDFSLSELYLGLTSSVQRVLKYLLQMKLEDRQEDPNLRSDPRSSRYMVVQFNDERRYLVEKELQRDRERSNYLCSDNHCVFKYLREGIISSNSESSNHIINCGVCEERVDGVSGQPAYTCHFCFLTLHKSCAELKDVDLLQLIKCSYENKLYLYCSPYFPLNHQVHACKSCMEGGKDFSYSCRSCLYQIHLKARKFPTIIHHDSHPEHFLSLVMMYLSYCQCNACGGREDYVNSAYGCYICELYYGIDCICLPRELEHMHGGHKHVLKLMYSHDHEEEEEESYWCEVCYDDMDPQCWFYSCQACPFTAHPKCINPFNIYDLEW